MKYLLYVLMFLFANINLALAQEKVATMEEIFSGHLPKDQTIVEDQPGEPTLAQVEESLAYQKLIQKVKNSHPEDSDSYIIQMAEEKWTTSQELKYSNEVFAKEQNKYPSDKIYKEEEVYEVKEQTYTKEEYVKEPTYNYGNSRTRK